jgi:hypothetical protein
MKNRVGSSNDKNKDAVTYSSGELNTQYAGVDESSTARILLCWISFLKVVHFILCTV